MTEPQPMLSLVIPCRNEAGWIRRCLDSIVANDYPHDRLEVLVVDGMSDDGTRPIVEAFAREHPFVHLLDNPRKIAPSALNVGVAAARGEIIMRMDAHYEYPANYISCLVDWLQRTGADNVGGLWILDPANQTATARAIAAAVCHPFGVGNAFYRTGVAEPRWVDTVPFGCYRREVFDRIGLFDEDLVRNQDIEFNLRLRRAGGSILLVPDVVLRGHARDTLKRMAKMHYQYGYFNPMVIRKLGSRPTLRQAVTPMFVLSLVLGAALAPWFWPVRWLLAAVVVAYATLALACCAQIAWRQGCRCGLAACIVFPLLHISHGLGFLKGAFDLYILRRSPRQVADRMPLTR